MIEKFDHFSCNIDSNQLLIFCLNLGLRKIDVNLKLRNEINSGNLHININSNLFFDFVFL